MRRFGFIHASAARVSVRRLCRLLNVSAAGYYAWRERKPSARDIQEERVVVKIKAFQKRSKWSTGSPRMHDDLLDDGEKIGRHRVARIMRDHGLNAFHKKGFARTTDSSGVDYYSPDLLQRNFETELPNEAWVGDITYLRTKSGYVYLAVLLDLFSRAVVGWTLGRTLHTELPLKALKHAIGVRSPKEGFIHHTDRGAQYASSEYRQLLNKHGAKQSMSRKGDCWDNAVAESFFASLKKEWVRNTTYESFNDAYRDVASYIDGFYNPIRRHSSAGRMSPHKYEAMHRKRVSTQ